MVYEEMRKLASAHLKDERTNHTLQPTGLVHRLTWRKAGPEVADIGRLAQG